MNELRYTEAAQAWCLDCKLLHNVGTLNMMRSEAITHLRQHPSHRSCVERASVVVFTMDKLTPQTAASTTRRADLE